MKALALLLTLCASTCLAQMKPAPVTKLAQCQTEAKAARSAETEWSNRYYAGQAERDALATKNKELEAQNAELSKKMEEIKAAALELLKADQVTYPAAAKLQKDYGLLVDKYNRLLSVAQNQETQLQVAARQQRVSNALTIYSMMPKYTPMQLPPPPVFTNNTFNCRSNTSGTTTYTNCQ